MKVVLLLMAIYFFAQIVRVLPEQIVKQGEIGRTSILILAGLLFLLLILKLFYSIFITKK